MYICDEMMIERRQETIQSDCSMNCGLCLMRKSTYHIRVWTHTREKPPLGGDLLHYPLLQVPPLKNATSPSPKSSSGTTLYADAARAKL